ncbi:MAG: hypothetical protein N2115_00580 [bacterium]|nr:hypothetical protein [bacterium]
MITGRISGILEKFKEPNILSAGIVLVIVISMILLVMTIPQRINLRRYSIKLKTKKEIQWYNDDTTALTLAMNILVLIIIIQIVMYLDASIYVNFISQHISYPIVQIALFSLSMFFIFFIIEVSRMRFSKYQDSIPALIIFTWFIAIPIVITIYISQAQNKNYFITGISPTNFFIFPEFIIRGLTKFDKYVVQLNVARAIAIVCTSSLTYS